MQMLVDLTHRVHGMIDFTDVRPVAPGRDRLTSSENATRRNQRIEELARLLLGDPPALGEPVAHRRERHAGAQRGQRHHRLVL